MKNRYRFNIIQIHAIWLAAAFGTAPAVASVSGPGTSSTGEFTISWTNMASSTCSSPYYKVSEYKNNVYQGSSYITSRTQKSKNIVKTESGSYRFDVSYKSCGSSLSYSYLSAGSTTVNVELISAGATVYKYDAAGRLIKVEKGNGAQVDYTLDDAGNRTKVTQQGGN